MMQYPFDGSSLQFEGTWYNPKTNDTVTVRDTLFENNQIVIRTNDGRMIPYEKFQNYVKVEKGFKVPNKQPAQPAQKKDEIPAEVLSEIAPKEEQSLESFDDIMSRPLTNVNNSPAKSTTASMINTNIYDISTTDGRGDRQTTDITPYSRPVLTNVNINYEIIQKALKDKPMPKCDVKISWKDCPLDNIRALVDMFGISRDELVEYYNSRIDVNEIVEKVKTAILEVFTPEKKTEEEVVEKKEEPKKEKKPVGRPKGSGKKK